MPATNVSLLGDGFARKAATDDWHAASATTAQKKATKLPGTDRPGEIVRRRTGSPDEPRRPHDTGTPTDAGRARSKRSSRSGSNYPEVRFSLRVDVATEERLGMYGYAGPGLYGQRVPTTTIMFLYLIWFNYTGQQLNVATVSGGNLPYVGGCKAPFTAKSVSRISHNTLDPPVHVAWSTFNPLSEAGTRVFLVP